MDRLGQGGMASLYLARDPMIDRLVAIKVLREGFDEELRERFAREARSAGSLRHLNIVTIFDVGEHEGEPFIAMEYVAGETLAQMVRRRAPLGLARKVELLEALCAGLGYAHQAGIVHRDIKPANIMVDTEGVLKILDFGIARVGDSSMTQAGMLVGTLNYMSPEQVAGQPVDHRSDIFAVGAVSYEFLTYRQAFPGNLQTGILHRIMHGEPEPVEGVGPVDADLARIINRALEKDPSDRYPDLGVMRKDLARVRRALPEEARAADEDGATVAILSPAPLTPRSARRPTDVEDLERRRARQIEEHLATARDAERAGDFQTAIDAGEQVLMLDAAHAGARELVERVRAAQERARAGHLIAQATEAFERGAITEAALSLDRALGAGLDPASLEATRLKAAIALAREQRERAAAAQDLAARARTALDSGSPDSAIRLADEALALEAGQADAAQIRTLATSAIDQRRRKEEAERAAEAVRAARSQFASGEVAAAIGSLEAFSPPHEIVTSAIAELRAEVEAEARRQREAEEEARRRAEAERRARDARRARLIASARSAAAKERFDESLGHLREAEAVAEDLDEIGRFRAEVEAARAAAEAARERARLLAGHLSEAQQALKAGDFARGRERAEAALALEPANAAALKLRADADRGQAEAGARAQRARDRDVRVAEAEAELARTNLAAARQAIDAALALDRRHEAARRVDQAIKAAEAEARRTAAAAEAEARRTAEAAEAEARRAAAARERLEAAIEKARRATRPERAAALAKDALALDPGNVDAQDLLTGAQAEIARREQAELAERERAAAARVREAEAARAKREAEQAARAKREAQRAARSRREEQRAAGGGVAPRRPLAVIGVGALVLVVALVGTMEVQHRANRSSVQPPAGTQTASGTRQPRPASPATPRPQAPAAISGSPPPASTSSAAAKNETPTATSGSEGAAARDAIDAQLTDLRKRTREQLLRGNREDALASATRALALDRRDRATRGLVAQMLSDARGAASNARDAAIRSGAPQAAPPLYERGRQAERQAEALRKAGNEPESVRVYWKAQSFYSDAGSAAARVTSRPTPEKPAPAPPPAPGTTIPPLTSLPTPPGPEPRMPASPPPANRTSGAGTATGNTAAGAPPGTAATGTAATGNLAVNAAASEEASIRGVLQAYRTAYESLDADAVHRVQPTLKPDKLAELQKGFSDYRSYSVDISDVLINLAGTRATVSCRVTRRFVPKAGRAGGATIPTVFHLEKNGGSWVITSVEAR